MSYLDPIPIPHQFPSVFVSFVPSQGIFSIHNILPSPLFTLMLRGHFLEYKIFFQGLDYLSSQWKKFSMISWLALHQQLKQFLQADQILQLQPLPHTEAMEEFNQI